MKKQSGWAETIAVITTFIAIIAIIENNKKKKQIEALETLVKTNIALTSAIKKRLAELLENHPDIDKNITAELEQISDLLQLQQETKAVFALAKIIENLLKEVYSKDSDFTQKYPRATFQNYLDYAKSKGLITQDDYHLVSAIKSIRNEEAHELNVLKDKDKLAACIIAGIGFTFTLYRTAKRIVKGIEGRIS